MSAYERLSVLDRFFLDTEGDCTHMHIAAVMMFDARPLRNASGGIRVDEVRQYIESRIHLIPRYRQKLMVTPITRHPYWVDDKDMNLDYHVRHTSLPKPGSVRQLKRLAARVMSQKLDRGKPLWEIWIVEGLADDRFAIIAKTHHCLIDGLGGVDLMTVLFDRSFNRNPLEVHPWSPPPPPMPSALLKDEFFHGLSLPGEAARASLRYLANPAKACADAGNGVSMLAEIAGIGLRRASDTPLNRAIGPHRRFDWATVDLGILKAIKNELGGSINDVILATVAGAVGRFLELRGVSSIQQSRMDFRVFSPVSVESPNSAAGSSQVTGIVCPLPIASRDGRERLDLVRQSTEHIQSIQDAVSADTISNAEGWMVPNLLSLGARVAMRSRAYNLVVTNVPGPQHPLDLLGAKLLEPYPLAPLFVRQTLGIGLFSYAGKLCWGINADWDQIPDLHDFVRNLRLSLQELISAAKIEVDPCDVDNTGLIVDDEVKAPRPFA